MKTLKELIHSVDQAKVLEIIVSKYDDGERNLAGYTHVFLQLRDLAPGSSTLECISVRMTTEDSLGDGVEEHADVSGLDKKGERFAIEFTPWDQWLGLPVRFEGMSVEEAVAHCIWEMTFFGFTPEKVKEAADELDQSVKDVLDGIAELSEFSEFKSVEELLKELKAD